jgi:DNA-binding transcriptional LysR family regulator
MGAAPELPRPYEKVTTKHGMNIHHLELFYYVAKHEGISRAVRRMPYGIQQPAVSSQMLALEQDLGTRLFERNPFCLTDDGRTLYSFVSPFFEGIEPMARRLRKRSVPLLRIGAAEVVLRDYLPPFVQHLRKMHPGIQLNLRSGYTPDLLQNLLGREIDLAVVPFAGKTPPRVKARRIISFPIALLVPVDAPLQTAADLWKLDVVETPLISLPDHETISLVFQRGLRGLRVEWPCSIEASSVDIITHYVANGYGYGVTLHVPQLVTHPLVRVLPLSGFDTVDMVGLWIGAPTAPIQTLFAAADIFLADCFPPTPLP